MKENIIQTKSYEFALKIVKLHRVLVENKKEFVLSKQLLRCGTSIGANIEEAIGGQSEKDFYAKLTFSYKEARETKYWISLLKDSEYLDKEIANDFLSDVEELLRIIGSIQKTLKSKNL